MIGLFGALDMGARSLDTQQQGIEVAGHNLANVNNPAYARQRLTIQTSPSVPSDVGPQGTGADAVSIVRLRSDVLDDQIQSELSVRTSLEAEQSALQSAEAGLGEQLDASAAGTQGSSSVGNASSLSGGLSDLFNSFQALSTDPSSLAQRQIVLGKASDLATQFNHVDQQLANLSSSLSSSVQDDVGKANTLLSQIAGLNDNIAQAELDKPGSANDLRDTRQSKIEELAKLVKIDISNGANGAVNVSVAGTLLVSANQVSDQLQAYDAGGGQIMVRAAGSGTALALTGGEIQGMIQARDDGIAKLRQDVNTLASQLIQKVNAVHGTGYGLNGTSGTPFFSGSNAADIQVNSSLTNDPSLLQAASVPNAAGDNGVALALGQLGEQAQPALNNQTFSQSYNQTVSAFGQTISSVNNQLSNQQTVEKMLLQQRDSISGVSVDEEMTDLTKFQRAFEASAKLITTIDDLLTTVINMKQ